jgi:hypothetical protein
MNISFVMVVDGTTLFPTAIIEGSASAGAVHEFAAQEHDDRSTPLVPIGSSVLAPGLEAAVEF